MTTLIPKIDLKNGGTTPAGAINRPFNEKLAETISVKDFGAIGDGTTDDTIAINAALVAAEGNELYFPAGTYLCGDTIYVYNGTKLLGAGFGATTILAGAALGGSKNLILNKNPSAVTFLDQNIIVDGIFFDGNNLSFPSGIVTFGKVKNLLIQNCKFANSHYMGLAVSASTYININNNIFTATGNPAVTAEGGAAIWMDACTFGSIQNNNFNNLNWSAIYGMCTRLIIDGNTITNVKESAIYINDTVSFIAITNNIINGTVKQNISAYGLEISCAYTVISGNSISNTANCFIGMGASDATITGNTMNQCGTDQASFPEAPPIVLSSSTPITNVVISDNVIINFATPTVALVVGNGVGNLLQKIVVSNNIYSGNTFTSGKTLSFGSPANQGNACLAFNNIGTVDSQLVVFDTLIPSNASSQFYTTYFPQGSQCWNSVATVGQPKGWTCTVTGAPGTWASMGNL